MINRGGEIMHIDAKDIPECVSDEQLPIYVAYKKHGECVAENELFKTVEFTVAEQKYTVYQSITQHFHHPQSGLK